LSRENTNSASGSRGGTCRAGGDAPSATRLREPDWGEQARIDEIRIRAPATTVAAAADDHGSGADILDGKAKAKNIGMN
jgi:hypothetical protein